MNPQTPCQRLVKAIFDADILTDLDDETIGQALGLTPDTLRDFYEEVHRELDATKGA
ncbi:hypothetical protein Dxin01_00153 [Deinococcus xinjiangensis]|uniref:Uncharacterized protein n=1 Tax=Deinococcus xinjiangensis TaxID=457454 RepID=A0ABP9V583_9DEIO